MTELPAGTITLLFADIERSTALLRQLGPERYGETLAQYRQALRGAVTARNGVALGTEGDGFFAAFPSARDAVAAAAEAQEAFARSGFSVRIGLHTGEPLVVNGQYSGIEVHRGARIAAVESWPMRRSRMCRAVMKLRRTRLTPTSRRLTLAPGTGAARRPARDGSTGTEGGRT